MGGAESGWQDFELAASSPAVDAALPEYATSWDYAERARPLDGNDDGDAQPDVGALERVP